MGGFFDAQEAPELTAPTPNMAPAHSPSAAAAAPAALTPPPAAAEQQPSNWNGDGNYDLKAAQQAAEAAPDNRPPWEKSGEPFDPARAWTLIQNKTKDLEDYKTRTDPIVAEREQLRRASQTDLDRANEDLGKANATAETWRTEAIRAKAEALAAGRFVDAETALALIGDVSTFVTGDQIDIAKLTARLDQLAADKPFLVAAPPQPPGFTPNRAQGQAGTGGALPLDAQIKDAEKRGDFAMSIALKQQRYHQTQNRS